MLAYELYLNNKGSKSEAVKSLKLIKKMFANKNGVEIDTKTLDEYGTDIIEISQSCALNFLQQWLSMPLNTADQDKLNLPDKRTGVRSPSPYVKIYGKFVINKKEKYISLEIEGKDPENIKSKEKKPFRSKLDLSTHEETLSTPDNDKIVLNIEKSKYQIAADDDAGYAFAFEDILIDKGKISKQSKVRNPILNDYLNAVRSLITGTYFEKSRLIEICSRKLKSKIFEWLDFSNKEFINKKINEAKIFFIQSEFCFKTLLESQNNPKKMDSPNELYAYNIGLIAGRYMRFKIENEKGNNSLRDILTYSKYDRDRLRTVFRRIGLGLNVSKGKQSEQDKVSIFIKNNSPKDEITEDKQDYDYSYFFYKGVFQQLAGDSD